MSIRILTKNAVENTNIDGARQNHFNSGMQSGVVKGAFNEGDIFSPALNAIAIDSCELRISGHQIVIDSAEYITLNDKPYDAKRLSLIAQIKVTEFSEPEFEFIVQAENVKLIQDNLFENERGNGIYQLKLCNFTLGTDGVIRNVIRVVETITGGTNSAVKTDIEFTATATELSASSQPEAVITYNHETDTYDLVFGIPRGGGTDVQVGGISQGILKFDSDPQQQLDTLNAKIGTASSFKVEIVDELPTENISTSTFYLIKSKTEGENIYNEYLYVNGVWEALGTTSIEAYDDTELRRLIESKADKSALENLSNLVANKVDTTTFNTETARLQGGIKDNTDEIIEIQNAGYITKEVNNLTNYTKSSDLSKVATSNDYNDLDSKPAIPNKLPTPNKLTIKVTDQTPKYFDGSEAVEVNIDLPNVDGLVDIVNGHSESLNEINAELAGKADKGSVTANTNAISTINSKLNGIQSGAEVNVQSDWNVTDTSSDAYIKNKPTIPSISGLASESYVNTQVNTLQGKIDGKQDTISDLATIRSGASAGATAVQPSALESQVSTLQGKIDAKYTKPASGIPASDLAETYDTVTSVNSKTATTLNNAKSYTDTKIGELIGFAPETLDTLQEVAKAIKDNEDVVAGLNSAIGTKADKTTVDSLEVQVNTNAAAISNTYTKNEVSAILLGYATTNNLDSKVSKTTTINGKPLSSNIALSASDVGALPNTTAIPKLYDDLGDNTDGAVTQKSLYEIIISLGDEFGGAISELNTTKANQSDLDTTNDNVSANATNIQGLSTFYNVLSDKVDGHTTSISNLDNNKADKTDVQSRYNTLSNTKADKTSLESAVTELNEAIDDIRELVGESQGSVVKVNGTAQSVVEFTSNPQDQLNALNTKTGKTYYVDGILKGEIFNDYNLNVASGVYSHAEGGQTDATGDYSHSEGFGSLASNKYAHAEGNSTASGLYAHSEGKGTTASGDYSHSEGNNTTASHTASHSSGFFTKTGKDYQTVVGTRNVGKSNTLFEVGNGYFDDITGNVINQNAFEVKEDGTLYTQNGTLTDGTNSVSLGDVATKDEIPTDYVTNETYTSGLETKADKTVVSQIANPNLIINGDFRINQRGNTTYSSSGYTVDRWQNSNNYGTLTKSSNYITFSASGGTAYLVQRIEDSGNLVGKTVTLSVCLSDDTIYSATETLQAVANSYATIFFEWGNVRIYYYSATGYFAPTIHITDGNSVSVKWVKLELGSVATPYSIKPYAEELAMCERYFLKLDFISGQNIFVGFNGGSSASRILIPCHLRTSPTLRYSNVSHFGINTTGNPITATGLSLSGYTNVGVNITVNASGLTAGQGSNLYVRQAGAYLSFDAEIY